jgi:hypothetical protein
VLCDGPVLRRCVGGTWEETTCPAPTRCEPSTGSCRTCVLGEARCLDDKTLQLCDAASDAWVTQMPCGAGRTCDAVRGVCVACEPDLGVCIDETVICRCKADQSGFEPLTCPGGCSRMGAEDRCVGGEGVAGGPAGVCDKI